MLQKCTISKISKSTITHICLLCVRYCATQLSKMIKFNHDDSPISKFYCSSFRGGETETWNVCNSGMQSVRDGSRNQHQAEFKTYLVGCNRSFYVFYIRNSPKANMSAKLQVKNI